MKAPRLWQWTGSIPPSSGLRSRYGKRRDMNEAGRRRPSGRAPSGADRIARDDVAIERHAHFGQARLGVEIHVIQPEALFEPEDPFERSEEHTSELQSHLNLVCRLLLA